MIEPLIRGERWPEAHQNNASIAFLGVSQSAMDMTTLSTERH
jgi:hypothetical protein